MPRGVLKAVLLAGAVALAIPPGGAYAQTAEEDSVTRRARPDFDPIGIELDEMLGIIGLVSAKTIEQKSSPLSSFVVLPSFGVSAEYESNIFLSDSDTVADKRLTYSPGLTIQSDWASHSFALSGTASVGRYQDNPKEDFEDYQIQASGMIEVRDNTKLNLVGGFAQRHLKRNAEDDPGRAFAPIVSENLFLDVNGEYNADALLLRLGAKIENQDYLNSQGLDNDERDVTIVNLMARVGYEFTPGTTIFVEPRADFRSFDRKRDAGGFLQDNSGMGALFGVTWDITGVTFAEFGIGFSRRTYDEPTFASPTNLDFSGRVIWNMTDLLTFSSRLDRSTGESTTVGESGVLTTNFVNRLDYEFLDNIVLTAGLALTQSDNQELDRRDSSYTADLGASYLVNQNWTARLYLEQSHRSSTIRTKDYDNFVAGVTLTARL